MPFVGLVLAAAGLHLHLAGVTLVDKMRAVCAQLGVDGAELSLRAALQRCNEAMGLEPSGPLHMQTDALAEQLGLSFEAEPALPPPERLEQAEPTGGRSPQARDEAAGTRLLSVYDVMSATTMVHTFSEEVTTYRCQRMSSSAGQLIVSVGVSSCAGRPGRDACSGHGLPVLGSQPQVEGLVALLGTRS